MGDLLQTRRERVLFALLLVATLLVLAGARLAVGWLTRSTGESLLQVAERVPGPLLDNFIAALVSAAVVLTLYVLLGANKEALASVRLVEPTESNRIHQEAARHSATWFHSGHYGGWVRGEVLPAFADAGSRQDTEVTLIILDPRLDSLCAHYTRFRQSGPTRFLEKRWSRTTVYEEIYATILAAQLYNTEQTNLRVRVFLRKETHLFRMDLNDSWAAITSVDPREPPIFIGKASPWYEGIRSNFRRAMEQTEELTFLSQDQLDSLGIADSANGILSLMSRLDVALPACLTAEDKFKIAGAALQKWRKGTTLYR